MAPPGRTELMQHLKDKLLFFIIFIIFTSEYPWQILI